MKIDIHVHTAASPDSALTLEDVAAAAAKAGLFACAVCDRDGYTLPASRKIAGVLLLPGCEFTVGNGSVLALFCDREPDLSLTMGGSVPSVRTVADEIHRCGGLAVGVPSADKNAPFFTADELSCLDALETRCAHREAVAPRAFERAGYEASARGLCALGGSGACFAGEVGAAVTLLVGEAPRSAVQSGRCRPAALRRFARRYFRRSELLEAKARRDYLSIPVLWLCYVWARFVDFIRSR